MFEAEGFRFDMGPSWYWMPDIFEQFFARFGKRPSDYYTLQRLDPSYQVFFGPGEKMALPADLRGIYALFESYEPGSGEKLNRFLQDAEYKYKTGMQEFVFKPAHSPLEFAEWKIVKAGLRLQLLKSLSSEIRSLFKDPRLIQLLEFPVLFLGATPEKTPAMYSLMNYADMVLGTWYPQGGMIRIVEAMVSLAEELGVKFMFDQEVTEIREGTLRRKRVRTASGKALEADVVVGGGDYRHMEALLDQSKRQYSERYWNTRVMAPSALIYYLGVRGKLDGLEHHNLFFDRDFSRHSEEIYTRPAWPSDPLFYLSVPSRTDPTVAPAGHENLFLLMPVAAGLEDNEAVREHYFNLLTDRIATVTGHSLRERICYKRSYSVTDFVRDYHAFRGNAYGLANTLGQTAWMKPKLKSRKTANLYFTGQLTVPGPGIPPAIISGQIVAQEILRRHA